MQFLYDVGLFTSKTLIGALIFVAAVIFILLMIKAIKSDDAEDDGSDARFKFQDLMAGAQKREKKIKDAVEEYDCTLDDKEKKKKKKEQEKTLKGADKEERAKRAKRIKELEDQGKFCPNRVFVIDFDGDTKASGCNDLALKVNAILDIADDKDEVILNLDSPGGVVNGYGLASSTLERIRSKGIRLTVCVDNVAASGGYLMSCVAHKIVAAPFAYVGSIGVVANMPNFNKVLKKYDVDYEQITAGKYKRTLTIFGENTKEGREKFQKELEAIHFRFKEQVLKYRPHLDMDQIATGEFWLAKDAFELGLVDEINTFDGYLKNILEITKVCAIKISIEHKEKKSLKSLLERLFHMQFFSKDLSSRLEESDSAFRFIK